MTQPLSILIIEYWDSQSQDIIMQFQKENHCIEYLKYTDDNALDVGEKLSQPFDAVLMDIALVVQYCEQLPRHSKIVGLVDPKLDKPLYKLSALQKYCDELLAKPLTRAALSLLINKLTMQMDIAFNNTAPPKVLVVETDELVHYAAITILEDYFPVKGCSDLDQAIKIFGHEPIQVLLVGIDQKRGQVMEQIHWLRIQQPNLLVIIMTSLSNKQLVLSAIQGGVIDIIEKPLRPDVLIRTINRVWQLGQTLVVNRHLINTLSNNNHHLQTVALELAQFIEHSPIALAMFDHKYHYLVSSMQWAQVFKIDLTTSLVGQELGQSITDELFIKKCYESFTHCLQGLTTSEQEYLLVREDGSEDWLSWKAAPWRQKNGDICGVIIVIRVITERKNAETMRMELEQQLFRSQKLEAIGQFAGGLFHDLNKLLTPVIGNLDLLNMQLGQCTDEQQACLQEALGSAELIQNMAKQLLSVVRETPINLTPVDMTAAVKQALKIVNSIIPSQIKLVTEFDLKPTIINTDEAGITRILLNLVSNAIDAFNGKPGTITVHLTQEHIDHQQQAIVTTGSLLKQTYIKLVITDDGPGMDAKALKNIFQPLVTSKASNGGTGLGLSVVLRTVKQLNGHIHVKSQLHAGCSFSVYLPLTWSEQQ